MYQGLMPAIVAMHPALPGCCCTDRSGIAWDRPMDVTSIRGSVSAAAVRLAESVVVLPWQTFDRFGAAALSAS